MVVLDLELHGLRSVVAIYDSNSSLSLGFRILAGHVSHITRQCLDALTSITSKYSESDIYTLAAKASCELFVPWPRWKKGQVWTWKVRE